VDIEVVTPNGTSDERADRWLWAPPGVAGLQMWEQVALPLAAGNRTLLSLANTGPLAARRHALFLFDASATLRPEWFTRFFSTYMRVMLAVARRADLVITGSDVVRRELADLGVPRDRVAVVPLAVDQIFRPAVPSETTRVRHRYGLDLPYLVHLGWGDPRKDAATAVAAHAAVVDEIPHELVLLGAPNPYFAPVSLPEAPSIRRLGRVGDADLVPLIAGAHGLLYPSLYEGFGLPPLEAVACGTAAIVSDLAVLRETVGDHATYVPSGDVPAWADAVRRALTGALPRGEPSPWQWEDAADLLVTTLKERELL
jgi:glycosyltransferase involved in cell wall biosynthesis